MIQIGALKGFTLLELLMVVSIMSATAYVALSTLENDGGSRRYQATLVSLEIMRHAVVGQNPTQDLQSGYVVDNGVLPDIDQDSDSDGVIDAYGADDLHMRPAGYQSHGLQAPLFDSNPDAVTGLNNEDDTETELNADNQLLLKGFRDSGYVDRKPDATALSDGWGGAWRVSQPSADARQVTSYGGNGKADAVADDELFNLFDKDLSLTILPDDWLVDVAGWEIAIANFSGADISVGSGQCLRLSLLVFVNNATDHHWKRLTSACLAGNASTGSCLDGDGDDAVEGIACPASATVSFPAQGSGVGAFQPPTRIPQGEHLLVLVADSDASDAHNDGSESVHASMTSRKVRFYAKTARPDTVLVIR